MNVFGPVATRNSGLPSSLFESFRNNRVVEAYPVFESLKMAYCRIRWLEVQREQGSGCNFSSVKGRLALYELFVYDQAREELEIMVVRSRSNVKSALFQSPTEVNPLIHILKYYLVEPCSHMG